MAGKVSKSAKPRRSKNANNSASAKAPGGRGTINGNYGQATRFSSENQPAPELKRAGQKKRRVLKDLLETVVYGGRAHSRTIKAAAAYLGISEQDITLEYLMHFKQMERAIKDKNTFAYMAVMDRAFGKPVQPLSSDEEDGLHIKVTVKGGANAHNKH